MRRPFLFTAGLLVLALGLIGTAGAVEGDSLWSQTYGGIEPDAAEAIIPTGDGTHLIAGYTSSSGAGSYDGYLAKVDSAGQVIWQHTYGGAQDDRFHAITPCYGGGFLLAGYTGPGSFIADMWVVKVDAQGNQLWSRTYGGSNWDEATAITTAAGGGYMLAGWTNSYGAGYADMYLLKLNDQGDTLWTHTYGASNNDYAYAICGGYNDSYFLAGATYTSTASYQFNMVRVDTSGNLLGSYTYGSAGMDIARAIIPTVDGNYLLAGEGASSSSIAANMYVVKVTPSGSLLWSHYYGGPAIDKANAVIPVGLGDDFLLAGYSNSYGPQLYNMYLVKINAAGDSLWSRAYGGNGSDYAKAVVQAPNGNYLVAGYTNSFGSGSDDAWLMCVQGPSSTQQIDVTMTFLNYFPGGFNFQCSVVNNGPIINPFTVWARIKYPNGSYTAPTLGPIQINPSFGMTVSRNRTQLISPTWPPGVYTYLGYAQWNFPLPYSGMDSSWFTFTISGQGAGPFDPAPYSGGELFPGEPSQMASIPAGLNLGISPNPFNPTTVASYELRVASQVSLRVYDTAGRLVATLVEGIQEAGSHEATFDGSKLASGLYFVKMQAGSFTAVQKLMLVK